VSGDAPGAQLSGAIGRVATTVLVVLAVLLYLRSPIDFLPDGLGLPGILDDLVVLAIGLWWLRRSADPPGMEPPADAGEHRRARAERDRQRVRESAQEAWEPAWDSWRVLGIDKTATLEEITRAYREKMKLYHPDRVAGLGEDLQRLAHERVLEIRRAYDELSGSTSV